MRRVALLILTSCMPEPDFVLKQGVAVWDEVGLPKYTHAQWELGIDMAIREAKAEKFHVEHFRDSLNTAVLTIKDGPWPCDAAQIKAKYCGESGLKSAEFRSLENVYNVGILDMSCPVATSGWVHELCHAIMFYDYDKTDPFHEDERVWAGFCAAADLSMLDALCP